MGRVRTLGALVALVVAGGVLAACNPPLGGTSAISAGDIYTCALEQGGTVQCWGGNGDGNLGDGTLDPSGNPVGVAGLDDAIDVSTGAGQACALRSGGAVVCWGRGHHGQLGNGSSLSSSTPVTVSPLPPASAISVGRDGACALTGGTVRCWGLNDEGQLGDGTTTSANVPVTVTGLTDAVAISVGNTHACAARAAGGAVCWGDNNGGELGNGGYTDSSTPTTVLGLDGPAIASLSAGIEYTCALLADASVRCWGANHVGQFGDGTTTSTTEAVPVPGLSGVTLVDAGGGHTCYLLSDGAVRCTGFNSSGQLGNGTTSDTNVPVAVASVTGAMDVSAGSTHSCAVLADGTTRCWGRNAYRQLGDQTTAVSRPQPVTPTWGPRIGNTVDVEGGTYQTCAVPTSGWVLCWGGNGYGQLGNGSTGRSTVPVRAGGISTAVQVAAGLEHTCARLRSGEVLCWGGNSAGQLGTGDTSGSTTPIAVPGLTDAVDVVAGSQHTCAVRADGSVVCWGSNFAGQIGSGSSGVTPVTSPTTVPGVSDATDLAAGTFHTCVRTAAGGASCWGGNGNGEIGQGTTSITIPDATPVPGVAGLVELEAGFGFTCGRTTAGALTCWGRNELGQLGLGYTSPHVASPTGIPSLAGVSSIASDAGGNHMCAVAAGVARCWGYGLEGRLGTGSTASSSSPVVVAGTEGASVTGLGAGHSCVAVQQGYLRCWGANNDGQLGDGTRYERRTANEFVVMAR